MTINTRLKRTVVATLAAVAVGTGTLAATPAQAGSHDYCWAESQQAFNDYDGGASGALHAEAVYWHCIWG